MLFRIKILKEKFSNYIELTKPRISMLVLVTAYLGYYLGLRSQDNHMVDFNSWLVLVYLLIGTWATSASASVLNQLMEIKYDANSLLRNSITKLGFPFRLTRNSKYVLGLAATGRLTVL